MHCTEIREIFNELNMVIMINFLPLPFLYHPEEKKTQKVMYIKVLMITNSSGYNSSEVRKN